MHEVDMTKCLVLSMNEWLQQHDPDVPSVTRVNLQVGQFTCVEPKQLELTWRVAISNSWLEGAELSIEEIPLVARCICCHRTYSPAVDNAYKSPCCEHPMEDIVSGRELRIKSIDFSFTPEEPSTLPA
jgi:hydrogenase nickel incorporation protein HypA/HybF